jgi:hypothetical protein
MVKELTIKASLSYTDQDFRETVEGFCKGKPIDLSLEYLAGSRPFGRVII